LRGLLPHFRLMLFDTYRNSILPYYNHKNSYRSGLLKWKSSFSKSP